MTAHQLDLFGDAYAPSDYATPARVADAREKMLASIARLKAAHAYPWKDAMGLYLEMGDFDSNRRLLPPDENAALLAEFNVEVDRLWELLLQIEEAKGAA